MSMITHASPFFGAKPSAGNAGNLAKSAEQSLMPGQNSATAANAGSPFAAILNPQVQQALTTAANTAKGVTTPAAAPAAAAVPTGTTGAVHALTLQGLVAGGVNYNSDFKSGLFQVADANHDGLVTKTELEQQVVGGGGTVDEADSLYAAVGGHAGSRGVTLQQFNISLATPNDNNFGDQLFKTLDANGDGIVGTAELKNALQSMGDSTQQKQAVTARYAATAAGGMIRSDLTDPA